MRSAQPSPSPAALAVAIAVLTPPPLTPLPSPRRSTTVFSHAQTVVICGGCSTVLCQPTGGKARLTEGCSFRKKVE